MVKSDYYMSGDRQFIKTLRLNILELMTSSKIRKNKKKVSDVDILGQIHIIYTISQRKPTGVEVGEAIIYLLDRRLIEELPLGDVSVYAMTDEGKRVLTGIYDEDDTAFL
ncbi:MAG: hypothetical protein IH840_06040 [Candidatus Heimdallarchaeota archaeon]|nr:hypothetical protein [Candidatus Heimdallarchaeota archaeon]